MGEGSCRHENVAGARFCATCGVALGPTCPHCGDALSAGAAFCTSCGARVSAPGFSADVHGISAPVESAPRGRQGLLRSPSSRGSDGASSSCSATWRIQPRSVVASTLKHSANSSIPFIKSVVKQFRVATGSSPTIWETACLCCSATPRPERPRPEMRSRPALISSWPFATSTAEGE
jgi:hypothetical protein